MDILEAAARALARRGFVDATMHDIAKESGYTAASLYTYFRSKQEIFDALLSLLTQELLATFDGPRLEGLTFAQQVSMLLRSQLELADRRRDAFTVFFAVHSAPHLLPHRRGKHTTTGMDVYGRRLAKWFEAMAKTHELGPHDPDDLAQALVGILYAFFLRWVRRTGEGRLVERTDVILALFLHGAVGGPGTPRSRG